MVKKIMKIFEDIHDVQYFCNILIHRQNTTVLADYKTSIHILPHSYYNEKLHSCKETYSWSVFFKALMKATICRKQNFVNYDQICQQYHVAYRKNS